MKNQNIICVIVTYNRLALLKEAICSVKKQTYPVSQILIINNCSTDGTTEYLETLSSDEKVQVITMPKNIGGAGGFSEGIKQAAYQHAEWIWVMDDDTIPQPDALEQMMIFSESERVGFINSKALWTDGTLHKMNIPQTISHLSKEEAVLQPTLGDSTKAEFIESGSFVSLLIRGNLPWEIGLPYKEFFIWCDDCEYTNRMYRKGNIGVWAKDSVVLHKTKNNYVSSIKTIPSSEAWKLYYGVRNDSFLRRLKKGWLLFFFAQINCFRTHARRIKQRHLPVEEEKLLLKENNRGLRDGFTFNPKVEYLQV